MSRNYNLDVLRCLAMFAIVVTHVYQHDTALVPRTFVHDLLFFLLIRWHVDVFLSFSGWFGIKFSPKKFLKIWGLVAFYSMISIFVGRCLLHKPTPFKIDGGWFGNAYLCLMLVSPVLNAAIDNLVEKGRKTAWLAWGGVAAVMTICWASQNFYLGIGSWGIMSHSLSQMIYVYLTVRLIRLTNVYEFIKLRYIVLAAVAFVLGCLILGRSRTDYIAPYTIAMSVGLFVLFERYLRFPTWLCCVCGWAAPSMFGIYLLHSVTSFGTLTHMLPLKWFLQRDLPSSVSIVLAAGVSFSICLIIEAARLSLLRYLSQIYGRIRYGKR